MAYVIAESSEEPSYDDIMVLAKKSGHGPEDTMSKEEYDSLSDEEKEEIHQTANMVGTVDFDDDRGGNETDFQKYLKNVQAALAKKKEGKVDVRMRYKKNPDGSLYYGPDGMPVAIGIGDQVKDKSIGRVSEPGKNKYLFYNEQVLKYTNVRKTGEKDEKQDPKTGEWVPDKYDLFDADFENVYEDDKMGVEGKSYEELIQVMKDRMTTMVEKYGFSPEKFKLVGNPPEEAKELFNSLELGGKKLTGFEEGAEYPMPRQLKNEDSNCFGCVYYAFTGNEDTIQKRKGRNGRFDKDYTEDYMIGMATYIIYRSDAQISQDPFKNMLAGVFGDKSYDNQE